jgi:hypothetical protein
MTCAARSLFAHRGSLSRVRTPQEFLANPTGSVHASPVAEKKFSRDVENLIADFRGLPNDSSRSKLRATRGLGDLMEQILHKYRIGMATPEDAIRQAWNEIVGEGNATFCHPLRIDRERTLVIGVSNPVVRQELIFHRAMILERIRAIPAAHHISDLTIRTG